MDQATVDLVRLLHLLFFAAGMGAGIFAETKVLGRLDRPVTERCIQDAAHAHQFVALALLGLWATGLGLIQIRTGFDLSQFTPKLWTKLIVVSALTANALSIGYLVMPAYRRCIGKSLVAQEPRRIAVFVLSGAVSMASWIGAVALGSSLVLKSADWNLMTALLVLLYVGAVVSVPATLVALRLLRPHRETLPAAPAGI